MISKILNIFLLLIFLSSCKHQLPQELVLKFKNENAAINIVLNESNFSHTIYFGVIKITNLSNVEIQLPAWENKIFLSSNGKSYPIFLDYGYISNRIASDFISSIKPNEFFEHDIFVQVGNNFKLADSQIIIKLKPYYPDNKTNESYDNK